MDCYLFEQQDRADLQLLLPVLQEAPMHRSLNLTCSRGEMTKDEQHVPQPTVSKNREKVLFLEGDWTQLRSHFKWTNQISCGFLLV